MFSITNEKEYKEILNKMQMLAIKKMSNAQFAEFEYLNSLIKEYEDRKNGKVF